MVLYGKAIAVMVALSMEERFFDTDHLELMRGLASQAAVAIENARLFREEQSKSRHLALLNQISQNIITTLNLDEVLTKISGELQEGLNYDHIGIGAERDPANRGGLFGARGVDLRRGWAPARSARNAAAA